VPMPSRRSWRLQTRRPQGSAANCCCCQSLARRCRLEFLLVRTIHNPPLITPPLIGEQSIVMSVSVFLCLCVCLSVGDHIFGTTRPIFTNILCMLPMAVAPPPPLWQRSDDMLCTSGFMDDVIFAHKPRLFDVAAHPKRSAYAVLGLATNCAQ